MTLKSCIEYQTMVSKIISQSKLSKDQELKRNVFLAFMTIVDKLKRLRMAKERFGRE
jgi:hypothetical protein